MDDEKEIGWSGHDPADSYVLWDFLFSLLPLNVAQGFVILVLPCLAAPEKRDLT
jgi:hypothetical protein